MLTNNDEFKRLICQKFDPSTDYSQCDRAEIDGVFEATVLELALKNTSPQQIELGEFVAWRTADGWSVGKVVDRFTDNVAIALGEKVCFCEGTESNPVLKIEQSNNSQILKRASEVKIVNNYVNSPALDGEKSLSAVLPQTDFSEFTELIKSTVKQELEAFDFAASTRKKNCKKGTSCGNSCIKSGTICWTDLSPENKIAVGKLAKELKALKRAKAAPSKSADKTSKPSSQGSYEKFSDTFVKEYKQERSKQELRGVVVITKAGMRDRMEAQGTSSKDFETFYEKLKQDGKLFTVIEKKDELMQLVE
jgi:hypothetical protein